MAPPYQPPSSEAVRQLTRGWSALRDFLLPGKAEEDPGFKQQIRERATRGLYLIAAVTAFMPWLGRLFHVLANFFDPEPMAAPWVPITMLAAACVVVATVRTEWGRTHARGFGFLLGVYVATVLIIANYTGGRTAAEPGFSPLLDLTVVLIVALTAIPARPVQMLIFGWGIAFMNFAVGTFLARQGAIAPLSMHHYAGFDLIVLLCSVLAGVNYRLMYDSYVAQQSRLVSQSRLLRAETAVSFSRLSATLSHELNSPLGALASSVESLKGLQVKEVQGEEADRERTGRIREGLLDSAEEAVGKLSGVVARIQRITNLDRAEVTKVHIHRLLRDVAQMVSPAGGEQVPIDLKTADMPALTLRPQAISSVFSRLMQNAVRASDGSPVEVEAVRENGEVRVSVRDHGEGLTEEELRRLFEPGFRTRGSRIGASNWGLFAARHVIREHGGDISAARTDGGGTTITVRLPADSDLAAN